MNFSVCQKTGIAYHSNTDTSADILFLHGLGGHGKFWSNIFNALGKYRWCAVDLPGHGSSNELSLSSISNLLAKLTDFIECHELQNTTVIAHSLSGLVTLQLMASKDYFTKAVLIATDSRILLHPQLIEQVLAKHYHPEFFANGFLKNTPTAIVQQVVDGFLLTNFDASNEDFLQLSSFIFDDYSSINKPCLLISGKQDTVISPRRTRHLATKIANTKIIEVDDSGHYPHLEQPNKVIDAIMQFLN